MLFAVTPGASWQGSLKLSPVTWPVVLDRATARAEKTLFHLLNIKTDHSGRWSI